MEPNVPAASGVDVSVTATLERFSSYPDVFKAKLICAAAELEQVDQPDATSISHSPNRVTMMHELQHINVLATRLQQPSMKTDLGVIAAHQYLDLKQKQSSIPSQAEPRMLFTDQNPDTVKQKPPDEIEVHPNISVQKSIPNPQRKKRKYVVRKTSNIEWKQVQKTIINTTPVKSKSDEYLNHYLRKNFPSYIKRSSNRSKGTSDYSCKLSSAANHWGLCRMKTEIIQIPTTDGGFDVQLQVAMNDDCQCHLSTRKIRGLSREVFSKINTLVLTKPNLKPDQTQLKLIQQEMNSEHVAGPLFPVTTNKERLAVGVQIKNSIDYQKRTARKKGLLTGQCTLVGDIVSLKQRHLFSIHDSPIKNSPTELEIQKWGTNLFNSGQLNVFKTESITNYAANAYLCMTVLDPIPNEKDEGITKRERELYAYINTCIEKKQSQVQVEGHTLHTTVVFSSLGLLYNASQCRDLEWQCMTSSDGTDKIFSNHYQLLTMGVYNLSTHGVKSFRPFFYVLCVGERQECFALGCLAFLKYCRLLFNITNMDFKGGAVSDHSSVFTNIYKIAFPNTKMVQCHIHLERKLWKGKGNGAYAKHANDKSYFYNTCRKDVNLLHHCLAQPQVDTLSTFVTEAWRHAVRERKISKELVTTLSDSYMNDPDFNQWHVNTGGLTGYDPTQQPTERHMEKIKGTKTFPGLLNIGLNMGAMIEVELPKMIVNVSTTCMGVESHTCLQEDSVILQTDSNFYKELSLYYNSVTESIDTQSVHSKDTDKYEYFINTEEFVGRFFTDRRILEYYEALKGRTKETYQSREKYCECVSSMCLVTGTVTDNKVVYTGSCVRYWKTRYCPHAAYYQYKDRLKSLAVIIPTNRMSTKRHYDRRITSKTKLNDRYTSVAVLIDAMKKLVFKKATLYEPITKRMTQIPCVTTILKNVQKKNIHYCSEKLDDANQCELLIQNLNIRLRKWRGDQDTQEINYVTKQLQEIIACLRNT